MPVAEWREGCEGADAPVFARRGARESGIRVAKERVHNAKSREPWTESHRCFATLDDSKTRRARLSLGTLQNTRCQMSSEMLC